MHSQVLHFPRFRYILCTAFSTTSALTDWSSVFYSVIYTSLPTMVVGVFDKDLSHRTLLEYPKLYMAGHRQESYNLHLFWITMIDTLWQSLVLFYVPLLAYSNGPVDIWSIGSLWTISVVVLVNVHLAMDVHRWVLFIHLAAWGSIVITYICLVILDSFPVYPNYWLVFQMLFRLRYPTHSQKLSLCCIWIPIFKVVFSLAVFCAWNFNNLYRTIYHLATSPTYWLTILLVTILALLPRFLLKILQQIFWPSDIQLAREAEKFGRLSYHTSKAKQVVEWFISCSSEQTPSMIYGLHRFHSQMASFWQVLGYAAGNSNFIFLHCILLSMRLKELCPYGCWCFRSLWLFYAEGWTPDWFPFVSYPWLWCFVFYDPSNPISLLNHPLPHQ